MRLNLGAAAMAQRDAALAVLRATSDDNHMVGPDAAAHQCLLI
jgi:hypothetical protein